MEIYEGILTRRSVRKFRNDQVPAIMCEKVITAGMYAPSARNLRPWHFIVIRSKEKLLSLSERHPYAQMLKEAPLAILVAGNTVLQENEGYLALDCAAATQNILLAAHAHGLGSVWLGVYPRRERMEAMREVLNMPENLIPISLIALGYPAEIPEQPDRFEKEKISQE